MSCSSPYVQYQRLSEFLHDVDPFFFANLCVDWETVTKTVPIPTKGTQVKTRKETQQIYVFKATFSGPVGVLGEYVTGMWSHRYDLGNSPRTKEEGVELKQRAEAYSALFNAIIRLAENGDSVEAHKVLPLEGAVDVRRGVYAQLPVDSILWGDMDLDAEKLVEFMKGGVTAPAQKEESDEDAPEEHPVG